MNLIPRLHHFLFKIEKHLGEAGLLFGQRKDGFIYHLQAQRSTYALASRVCNTETNARFAARLVNRRIGNCLDLEFICRLYKDEAMVSDGARVAAEEISIEVDRSRKIGDRT